MKCLNCKKEFKAARSTAQFCSPKCRVAHNRKTIEKPGEVISTPKEAIKVAKVIAEKKKVSIQEIKPKVIGKPYNPFANHFFKNKLK